MSSKVSRFYAGDEPDHRGRFLADLQRWPSTELESVHDYIQWLFPLPEPSPVNPHAPVLDQAAVDEFHAREELRSALLRSFRMMLDFYSFEISEGEVPLVRFAGSVEEARWLTPGNHNLLRITRILRSVRLLGLKAHSQAFFEGLQSIYATAPGRRAIGLTSFGYWEAAALRGE